MSLTVGSLFSGIGGLDLGLERAGMTVAWQSEIDPYACRVLARHWPDVPNLGDVTTIKWEDVARVDLICGGYPCQPFSLVGSRRGTTDERHLWPFFADAIRHLRPTWVLLENVPGHLSMGFGHVLGELAELGYDAEWQCLPAAAFGAPHLRWRIFVVAYTRGTRRRKDARSTPSHEASHEGRAADHHHVADGDGQGGGERDVADPDCEPVVWPTESWRQRDSWPPEPDVGRVAHGVPARVDRLRTLGNAVVPQVAEYVGRRIMEQSA